MAVESPVIMAACVEATEFMDLSRKYRVTGVPKTIVNDTIEILGAVPEDTFVRSVVSPPGSESEETDAPSLSEGGERFRAKKIQQHVPDSNMRFPRRLRALHVLCG